MHIVKVDNNFFGNEVSVVAITYFLNKIFTSTFIHNTEI